MIRRFTFFPIIVLTFFAALLPGCKDFDGPQTVPAYIRIDNILGIFELPATIPVLKQGPHKVAVFAGIAVNGIKDTRPDYPFTAPAEYLELNLVPDSIITLFPIVTYWPQGPDENMHVRWMEDFDSGSLSLEATSQSNAGISAVSGPQAWHDPDGLYSTRSGRVVLYSDSTEFCFATKEEFKDLPTTGAACMLEMDYKCSDTCAMGIYYQDGYAVTQYEIIRLRPTGASGEEPGEWHKIYINIGPYLVDHKDSEYFKLYFSSWYNRNEGTQYFYFDNLKLIFRDR